MAATAAAHAQTVQIGIGDQAIESLSDPRFTALGIRTARIVLPWNIAKVDPARVARWAEVTQALGIEPYVALGRASSDRCPQAPCLLPADADYRAAFKALRQQFPALRLLTAWNEPNHAREPTAWDPAAAAHYADILADECPDCTVVAGDLLDAPGMLSYLSVYRWALTSRPAVWGLHNYYDTTYVQTTGTDAFLKAVDGPVWLTESGGIVTWRMPDGTVQLPYDEQRAAASLGFGLRLAAARSERIGRMYVYQWHAAPADDFDAGLVRPDGSERAGLTVLRDALAVTASTTLLTGETRGATPGGELVAPPRAPVARVGVGRITFRDGSVRVPLRCSGGRCRGRVTLAGKGGIAQRFVNGRLVRGTLAPRRRAFDLRAGARAVVRLPIPRPALLRAARRRARARVTVAPLAVGAFTLVVRDLRFPRSLQAAR
jgi:hypothetical protein